MSRPGVDVISRADPLPRSAPTDTGVCFMVGGTGKGPTTPVLCNSLTDYTNTFGPRDEGTILYDAVDVYFREGGAKVWIVAAPTVPDARSGQAKRSKKSDDDAPKAETRADAAVITPQNLANMVLSFPKSLGPGQVVVPSLVDPVEQARVLGMMVDMNRVALLEADMSVPDDYTPYLDQATALRATASARYGALFAPSVIVPGYVAGTTRTVGYPSVVAGQIARNDALFTANQASAGVNGQALFATDLLQQWDDVTYGTLNDAGVCMARLIYGGIRTYGFRTTVDPDGQDAEWLDFAHSRLSMELSAEAAAIGENYVFSQLDGRRRTISQFGGELRAMLLPYWQAGALYGDTSEDAFQVNVGETVNTEATIANGELHAVLMVKMSPFAEWVVIEIVKVATTESLAA